MRIRNSRSPFPPPSLPDPKSRSTCLLHSEDCFLVEETNCQIGWSFNPLKNPACQVTGEGSYGELNKMTSWEIEPINGQDEVEGKINCMQDKSSQVLGRQPEDQDTKATEGNEPHLSSNKQEYGNAFNSAVNFVLALPSASSELGLKQKPRRGRKRKESDQSGDANWFTEVSVGKLGKPQKREEHTANGYNGCMEAKKRKRGRPKKG